MRADGYKLSTKIDLGQQEVDYSRHVEKLKRIQPSINTSQPDVPPKFDLARKSLQKDRIYAERMSRVLYNEIPKKGDPTKRVRRLEIVDVETPVYSYDMRTIHIPKRDKSRAEGSVTSRSTVSTARTSPSNRLFLTQDRKRQAKQPDYGDIGETIDLSDIKQSSSRLSTPRSSATARQELEDRAARLNSRNRKRLEKKKQTDVSRRPKVQVMETIHFEKVYEEEEEYEHEEEEEILSVSSVVTPVAASPPPPIRRLNLVTQSPQDCVVDIRPVVTKQVSEVGTQESGSSRHRRRKKSVNSLADTGVGSSAVDEPEPEKKSVHDDSASMLSSDMGSQIRMIVDDIVGHNKSESEASAHVVSETPSEKKHRRHRHRKRHHSETEKSEMNESEHVEESSHDKTGEMVVTAREIVHDDVPIVIYTNSETIRNEYGSEAVNEDHQRTLTEQAIDNSQDMIDDQEETKKQIDESEHEVVCSQSGSEKPMVADASDHSDKEENVQSEKPESEESGDDVGLCLCEKSEVKPSSDHDEAEHDVIVKESDMQQSDDVELEQSGDEDKAVSSKQKNSDELSTSDQDIAEEKDAVSSESKTNTGASSESCDGEKSGNAENRDLVCSEVIDSDDNGSSHSKKSEKMDSSCSKKSLDSDSSSSSKSEKSDSKKSAKSDSSSSSKSEKSDSAASEKSMESDSSSSSSSKSEKLDSSHSKKSEKSDSSSSKESVKSKSSHSKKSEKADSADSKECEKSDSSGSKKSVKSKSSHSKKSEKLDSSGSKKSGTSDSVDSKKSEKSDSSSSKKSVKSRSSCNGDSGQKTGNSEEEHINSNAENVPLELKHESSSSIPNDVEEQHKSDVSVHIESSSHGDDVIENDPLLPTGSRGGFDEASNEEHSEKSIIYASDPIRPCDTDDLRLKSDDSVPQTPVLSRTLQPLPDSMLSDGLPRSEISPFVSPSSSPFAKTCPFPEPLQYYVQPKKPKTKRKKSSREVRIIPMVPISEDEVLPLDSDFEPKITVETPPPKKKKHHKKKVPSPLVSEKVTPRPRKEDPKTRSAPISTARSARPAIQTERQPDPLVMTATTPQNQPKRNPPTFLFMSARMPLHDGSPKGGLIQFDNVVNRFLQSGVAAEDPTTPVRSVRSRREEDMIRTTAGVPRLSPTTARTPTTARSSRPSTTRHLRVSTDSRSPKRANDVRWL